MHKHQLAFLKVVFLKKLMMDIGICIYIYKYIPTYIYIYTYIISHVYIYALSKSMMTKLFFGTVIYSARKKRVVEKSHAILYSQSIPDG